MDWHSPGRLVRSRGITREMLLRGIAREVLDCLGRTFRFRLRTGCRSRPPRSIPNHKRTPRDPALQSGQVHEFDQRPRKPRRSRPAAARSRAGSMLTMCENPELLRERLEGKPVIPAIALLSLQLDAGPRVPEANGATIENVNCVPIPLLLTLDASGRQSDGDPNPLVSPQLPVQRL